MFRVFKHMLTLTACVLLLSCGGSGSQSSSPTPKDGGNANLSAHTPEIGIVRPRYTHSRTGLEHEYDMIRQGFPLYIEIQSTMEVEVPIALNFRIRESKSVIEVNSGFPFMPSNTADTEFGTFLQFNSLNSITIGSWNTKDDIVSLTDEPVSVDIELLPGEGYLVNERINRVSYSIDNPDKARIDVSSTEPTIQEGEVARFGIGWSGEGMRPKSDLTVNLSVTQFGDIASTFPATIELKEKDDFSNVLEIPTIEDSIAEPNGRISVEVLPGKGYTSYSLTSRIPWYTFFGNPAVRHVEVLDNDQPRISISLGPYPVYEGDPATFIIGSETTAPASDLTVNISTLLIGDFFSQPAPTEFVLRAGMLSGTLSIPTVEDTVEEGKGAVRVELKPGSGYVLTKSSHIYSGLEVWDDDVPAIWVLPSSSHIMEGEEAGFLIGTDTGPLANDLSVNIAITRNGGDFLDSEDFPDGVPHETFMLAAGKEIGKLAYSTVDDNVDEYDGSVGLEIRAGSGYRLTSRHFAFVEIMDDDLSIRVDSSKSEVFEGDVASFLISTDDTPQVADRTVNLRVSQTGNFFKGELPTEFNLRAGMRSELLEFPTVSADAPASEDGSITVQIQSGIGYTAAAKSSATVTIKDRADQPVPTLLVTAVENEIEEGEPAMFRFVTDVTALVSPLTVHFTVQPQGDFLDQIHTEPLPATFNIEPGRTFLGRAAGTFGYRTENDNLDENDGSISITLQDRDEYNVLQDQGTATVQIRDNDFDNEDLPEISIAPKGSSTIIEGNVAEFRLFSNMEVNSDITVYFKITVGTDFLESSFDLSRDEVLLKGQRETTFEIPTISNGKKGTGGELTVALIVYQNYRLGAEGRATIKILENLESPELILEFSIEDIEIEDENSVQSSNEDFVIKEGDTARFTVRAASELERNAYVNMSVTGSEDLIDLSVFEPRFILVPLSGEWPSGFEIPVFEDQYWFSIPTIEDDIHESNAEFTVSLLDGNGYRLNNNSSLTVTVVDDDDEPVISITRESALEIEEGFPARFLLETPTAPLLDLPVSVTVSGAHNFIDAQPGGGSRSVVIEGGSKSAVLEVATVADVMDEPDAMLMVTVGNGTGYEVSSTNGSASVQIRDNDSQATTLPVITLSAESTDGVTEGSPVQFRLTSSQRLPNGFRVNVFVSESGKFVDGALGMRILEILHGGMDLVTSIATTADAIEEPNGFITVELLDGSGYAVGKDFRASVEVLDNDKPVDAPEIAIAADTDNITEGGIVLFRLTADTLIKDFVNVSVSVVTTENFVTRLPSTRTVHFPGIWSSSVFGVEILDDRIAGSDGTVTATIINRNGYSIGMNSSASVSVIDNDEMPVFSIEAVRPEDKTDSDFAYIDEGETAEFLITTPIAPALPMELDVYVGGTANFISGQQGEMSVKVAAGHYSANLRVGTMDNLTYEPTGIVRATIMDGDGYDTGQSRSAFFQVKNTDEYPEISISAKNSQDSTVPEITEGSPAEFELSSTSSLLVDLPVIVYVDAPPNLIANPQVSMGHRTVMLRKGSRTATFSINTELDANSEPDGTITALVLNSTGYEPGSSRARIRVLDDDKSHTQPVISVIEISTGGVIEGSRAYFQMSTPVAPSSAVAVNYNVSGTESFIGGSAGRRIEMLDAGSKTKRFHVVTASNNTDEPNGNVSVTIVGGTGYAIGQAATATVVIRDDDNPEDAPILSIFELPERVHEGENARFRVFATNLPASDLTVRFAVSGTDGFIDGGPGIRTFKIASARIAIYPFVTLSVATIDNSTADPDRHGSITVSLLSGVGYVLSTTSSTEATVTLYDNDKPQDSPVVTITADQHTTVTEGTPAWFLVSASTIRKSSDLVVGLYVDVPTSFVPKSYDVNWGFHVQKVWTVVIPAGQKEIRFGYDTENDIEDEPNGRITVTVLNRMSYVVGSSSRATVNVEDDDNEPVISVFAVNSWVKEGSEAVFRLSSPTDTHAYLNVNVKISQIGNYLGETGGFRTLDVESYSGSILDLTSEDSTFELLTENDNVDEMDGTITVTVLKSAGYSVGNNPSASISILDDDGEPSVIIERWSAGQVYEGESVGFYVQCLPAPQEDLDVELSLSYSGKFFGEVFDSRTVTIKAGTTTGFFNIPTFDDEFYEADGFAAAEIMEGNYGIGDQNRMSVAVFDNDKPMLDMPVFEISPEWQSVNEGETVQLQISAFIAPYTPTSVRVKIAELGNFVTGGAGERTVAFLPGQLEQILEIHTIQDDYDELDGSITATLIEGEGYGIGLVNSALVEIFDDEVPEVSISIHTDSEMGVSEADGAVAKFVIETLRPWRDLEVKVMVDDGAGDVLLRSGPYEEAVRLPANELDKMFANYKRVRVTYEVPVKSDDIAGMGGEITATILGDPKKSYVLGSRIAASVNVTDDDSTPPGAAGSAMQTSDQGTEILTDIVQANREPLPEISIRSVSDSLEEGETAEFEITSDIPVSRAFHVNTTLQQTGDFVLGDLEKPVRFDSGRTAVPLFVQTQDDLAPESDGTITVTVQEGVDHTVSMRSSATVSVSDAEDRERHERLIRIRRQIADSAETAMPAVIDALSTQSTGAAFRRMDIAFEGKGAGTAALEGNSELTDLLRTGGEALNSDSSSLLSILDGEAFSFGLYPEKGTVSPATVWGIGNSMHFSGKSAVSGQESTGWSGNLMTGQFGIDWQIGSNSLAGFSTTIGESKADFASDSTVLFSRFATVQSHAGFMSPEKKFQLQTVAGYGTGDTDFSIEDFEGISVRSHHYLLAGRGKLRIFGDFVRENGPELALIAGAGTLRQLMYRTGEYFDGLRTGSGYYHFAINGSHISEPASNARHESSVAIVMSGRSGKSAIPVGISVIAETEYRDSHTIGIGGAVGIRPTGFEQREFASFKGSIDYDNEYDKQGLLARMSLQSSSFPDLKDTLNWSGDALNGFEHREQHAVGMNFNSELGYGIRTEVFDTMLTPFGELELNNQYGSEFSFGGRLTSGLGLNFELKGTRNRTERQKLEYGLNFTGKLKM